MLKRWLATTTITLVVAGCTVNNTTPNTDPQETGGSTGKPSAHTHVVGEAESNAAIITETTLTFSLTVAPSMADRVVGDVLVANTTKVEQRFARKITAVESLVKDGTKFVVFTTVPASMTDIFDEANITGLSHPAKADLRVQ